MRPRFLAAGLRELRRKFERYTLGRKLRRNAEERDVALGTLGARAWAEKIDLEPFGDLRDRLHAIAARSGELAASTQQLETQKSALEAERRDALEELLAGRRALEDKKRPVDAALSSASQAHAGNERSIAQARTRLTAIDADLAALERGTKEPQAAAGTDAATATAAARAGQTRLRAEMETLTASLTAAEGRMPGTAAEVGRLQRESAGYVADIAAVDAERKAVAAGLDSKLARIGSELQAASQQRAAVGKEQSGLHRDLGNALYDSRNLPATLDEAARSIAAIDAARAETQSRVQASLLESQALPPGTMPKFWGTAVGVPLLAAVLGFASVHLAKRYWPEAGTAPIASADAKAEDEKDQAVQRFIKAGKAGDEQTRRIAVRVLKEDILAMGGTADPAHLRTLARILRSPEPELRTAAADAMGMIRPTAGQSDLLAGLLKDPDARVAEAARRALRESTDPAARGLAAVTPAR